MPVAPAWQPLTNTMVVIYMGTFAPRCASRAYQPLADVFSRRGYNVVILALPKFGLGKLDEASDALAEQVFSQPGRFILVGHSQGALHAFHHARYFGERVAAVLAFGAPFHGTRLANLGSMLRVLPAIPAMAAHSQFLHELREDQTYRAENVHSLFSVLDELVVPWFASSVVGAHNVVLAPRALHGMLIRAGLRRSHGVELIDGLAEHLGVIWHPALHRYVEHVLDQLERGKDPAAA